MHVEQIRFAARGEVDVVAVEEDLTPAADEVLIAPERVGICGSDVHLLHGRHPFVQPPVITGHEVSGTVIRGGEEVTSLTPGQRVLVNPLFSCGHCARCRRQQVNRCEEAKVLGFKLPGAAQTRVVLPSLQVHPIPDSVSADAACLAEPFSAGYHAVRRIDSSMEDVLVLGGGPIGLCVLLAAKALGADHVTVVEPVAAKRKLALELGARCAVTPDELAAQHGRYTAVLDCVATQETVRAAVERSVGGGTVVMVGVPGAQQPELPMARMQRFEIDLLGSGLYTPGEVDAAIRLIADGTVDPTPLVSASYEFSEAAAAYRAAAEPSQVKVLIGIDR